MGVVTAAPGAQAADRATRAALGAIWDRTRPVLLSRVDRLAEVVAALLEGRSDAGFVGEAERLAHQIAGSAGTFGYHRATEIARELEQIFSADLEPRVAGSRAPDLLDALRRDLAAPMPVSTGPPTPPASSQPAGAPPATADGSLLVTLRETHREHRYRLLAVDDDPVILGLLKDLFAGAGPTLTTLADPLQFWDVRQRTVPDLVLLDVDMPQVTGLELCRQMRADPRWGALPVLVLTGVRGPEMVHQVFAAGADDFVSKPVVGEELLIRVNNRLERVRLYRELAETDPLTGLANRRKFTADFDRLRRMATRYHQPLSFALLDLDKFKRVNDTYGHAVGDVVLQRLGGLLSRHFRGEDLVARWGGEEVALGLYGMSRVDGVAQVASALETWREETFSTPGQPPLRVTFSGGVARYGEDGDDLRSLYRAADEVLYRAKALGGNRILPVGWQQNTVGTVDVVVVGNDEKLSELLSEALATRGLRRLKVSDGPAP